MTYQPVKWLFSLLSAFCMSEKKRLRGQAPQLQEKCWCLDADPGDEYSKLMNFPSGHLISICFLDLAK